MRETEREGERASEGERMSEFLVVGLCPMSVSPPFCCRSVWHQECKLDGVERGGKPKPQRIFPSFRTDAGGYGTRATREREGGKETDRHPPSPFLSTSCQPVGPAIVSSTMKKKDSWTRFGREITAFAAGKRLGRGEEIFRPRRRRICRHFHAFSRRPYGAMIGRRSLASSL